MSVICKQAAWAALALFVSLIAIMDPALAQQHPFSVGGQETLGSNGSLAGLILAWQNKFNSELQQFDDSFETLKKQLKEKPTEENIANMLRFYKDKLLTLEENIQKYRSRNIQNKK